LCLFEGGEDAEELTDVRHVEQRLHLRIHSGKRQLAKILLQRYASADERAQSRGIHVGNTAEVDDQGRGSLVAHRRLKREERLDGQRAYEAKDLLITRSHRRNNFQLVVCHGAGLYRRSEAPNIKIWLHRRLPGLLGWSKRQEVEACSGGR
jgi:hypothetical protein